MLDEQRYVRHKMILESLATDCRSVYALIKRNRNGVETGARFFMPHKSGDGLKLEDVTAPIATVTSSDWDDKSGYLKTHDATSVVDDLDMELTTYRL